METNKSKIIYYTMISLSDLAAGNHTISAQTVFRSINTKGVYKSSTLITEYKKLPEQKVQGTSYAVEYSLEYKRGENEPYYPVITEQSKELYARYQARADKINGLYYCGRLADFKYYNMDQALARALDVADKIKT